VRPLEAFDALLLRSDPSSSDWADGGGCDRASELLRAFSDEDWGTLDELVRLREQRWRACLAEALTPSQGAAARRLLLELTCGADAETAFSAALSVAFHCGVSDGGAGPFVDPALRDQALFLEAQASPALVNRLRSLAADCDPRLQQRLVLLMGLIESDDGGTGSAKA
jgi:hypothetical protein